MKDLKTFETMFYQLYSILNTKQRRNLFLLLIVIVVGSGFELLGVSIIMPFIEAIVSPTDLLNKKIINMLFVILGVNSNQGLLLVVGIGIVIVYVAKNIFLAFSSYLQASYGNTTQKELSVLMLESYMERPYSFFVNTNSGDIMRGVTSDIYGVYVVIINAFKMISEVLTILLITIYLFITDWMLALGVIIVGFICMLIIILGLKKKLTYLASLYREATAEMNRWIVQSINGIKDIMVFDRRRFFVDGYENAYSKSNTSSTNYTFACGLPERVIEAFCISGIIITVLIRLQMGVSPEYFVPKMAVFAMGAFRILPSISRSTGYIATFVYHRQMVESTYENITNARKVLEEKECNNRDEYFNSDFLFEKEIIINNLVFSYDGGKNKVLDEFSLNIKKGQVVGIIGESGAGKSTFSDVLLRLYKPDTGDIKVDNVDINEIPQKWARIVGYVPQTVFLMDDTIEANVVFGAEIKDKQKVWNALDKASLGDFVRKLPNGLDTIVGERGVKFSGGQRQRIAIARALYNNPQVLILDEATSALDNDTEENVMDAIDSLAGSVTLIIIAHRLSTLSNCDKIYEIKNGKGIEHMKTEILNHNNN